jgi:hypothetical protein
MLDEVLVSHAAAKAVVDVRVGVPECLVGWAEVVEEKVEVLGARGLAMAHTTSELGVAEQAKRNEKVAGTLGNARCLGDRLVELGELELSLDIGVHVPLGFGERS